jgi:translation initiation factor 2B subunit (eIF-2B alpha/beta/delta family)
VFNQRVIETIMIMKKQILLLMMMMLSIVASADTVEINGIYYNLYTDNNVAVVTRNHNKYTGSIVIPNSIKFNNVTYSVTIIDDEAFYNCSGLTSITIGNSVTSIRSSAFSELL